MSRAHAGAVGCLRVALLLAACAGARADDGAPPETAPERGRVVEATWARLPPDGTWTAGLALDVHGSRMRASFRGDAVRLQDPRPGADDAGMLVLGLTLGRRIAGGPALSLHGQAAGSLSILVIGDVGFALPGIGAGLVAEWRIAPRWTLAAGTRVTVPIPLADSSLALRAGTGPFALSVGWRDVRFLPVFGLPGRYSSGPQLAIGARF